MINFYNYYNDRLDCHDEYSQLLTHLDSSSYREQVDWTPILHIIKRIPKHAYFYAREIIKGRWLEAEPVIMKDMFYNSYYAADIIKGRWIEAEPYIIKDPFYAYRYARNIIKGQWIEAEPYIMESAGWWHAYCCSV